MSRRQGFTVLELLMVIAMITILLGIVMVSFTRAKRHVSDDVKLSQFHLVQLALEQYRAQCKVYPIKLDPAIDNPYPVTGGALPCTPFENFLAPGIDLNLFQYTALGSNNAPAGAGYCSLYHLSTVLDSTNDQVPPLSTDSDYAGDPDIYPCGSGSDHVDYDDAQGWYDVRYP